RVGYIQESPLWKTSYRLVLREGEAPLMQGWAIVENTTEHDWRDVRLTLVNGRPISFIMDLYQPLYVARPVVAPETFASLRPQLHAQDLAAGDALQKANAGNRGRGMGGMGGGMMGGMGGGMGGGVAPAADADMPDLALQIDPSAGVEAAAKGSDVGELFRYEIDEPIKLARQQSAMLPIINGKVTGEKVSLFNGSVESKHPLDAVQLTNSTPLHWMQGPITVFDGGEYAGDARIEDLAPGGQRLISYALDLDTEVSSDSTERPKEMISAQLQSGRLIVRHRLRRLHIYTVKNSSERAKKVLIEQPIDADWKLVGTRPAEQTRSLYRFAVQAEPGKPERLVVEEEQPVEEQLFAAALADPQDAQIFLKSDVVSDEVKQAIAEVVRRNQARAKLAARMTDLDKRIHLFTGEQERIRENMKTLDHDSDLYRRFVKKLGVQEDEIEKIRAELEQLKSRQQELDTDLEKYLSDLKLD
ncbi:MAG TPA: hypothetical protein VMF30_13825, partial [Pirellulales bacterium]|nr:hypothetical protein [Pirellulales bacterium]